MIKKVNAIQATDTSDLVKKTDCDTKIGEIENKIVDHDHDNKNITTPEFSKFTAENFATRLTQKKLAIKAGIDDFVEKTNFDDKLRKLNKKVTSNKAKHLEAEKKLTDLTTKFAQLSDKGDDFLLGRMYFTGGDGYENFLNFVPMLSSLILDSNKKVINWISPRISSEKN